MEKGGFRRIGKKDVPGIGTSNRDIGSGKTTPDVPHTSNLVSSGLDESEQIRVEHIRMRGQHAMRVARISLQRPVLEQLDRTRH